MEILYGKDDHEKDTCNRKAVTCGSEPPKWEEVERCCPTSDCGERCPPKTRARDAIHIDRKQVEACFLFSASECGGKPLPLVRTWVSLEIRKKGFCKVLTCLPPTRMREDGALCFTWTDEFRKLPQGYYEGDLYIDGRLRMTLLFYIPPEKVSLLSVDMTEDDNCSGCGKCEKPSCDCKRRCCDGRVDYDEEYKPIDSKGCVGDC